MQKKTDKFFDKIVKKDYNNELEKVLEKKYFDESVKNLLLSILYKIETAYKDYEKVKQEVEPKEEFIQNIISNIEKNCEDIKLITPNSEENNIIGNRTFLVEKNKKRIICYPMERKLLYSIAKISKNEKIIKDDYFLINQTLSNLINVGNNINTVEPLRDFNGYSWTTIEQEIESIKHNLIYQNLRMLVGNQFLNAWIRNNEFIIDYLEVFQTRMEDRYGEKESKKLVELIKKISVLMEFKFDSKTKEKIIKMKKEIEAKLKEVEDNKKFVQQVTKKKKQLTDEIKDIDETINNKNRLQDEYISRNENLPLQEKIFSIRILSKLMMTEREEKIDKIEKLNQLLNPQNFVTYKKQLTEKEKYLQLVEVEDLEKEIEKICIQIQKEFLKCYEKKIETIETKQDMIQQIYEFRYYCMLPYETGKALYEVKEIQKELNEIEKQILQKAHKMKVITTFSKEEEIDTKILKNIFRIRNINLEELYIKVNQEKDGFYVQLFEENVFEEKIPIKDMGNINKKDLEIKINKKIKIFN